MFPVFFFFCLFTLHVMSDVSRLLKLSGMHQTRNSSIPRLNTHRSKRGCNGGNPCEQCIRREQPCTYSQRRKSGPRGRPLRQQATSPLCGLGTRSSARKFKGTLSSQRDRSPGASGSRAESAESATSSPSRTASISTSCSDYSSSEASDSEMEEDSVEEESNKAGGGGKNCKVMPRAREVKFVEQVVSPAQQSHETSQTATPFRFPSQQTLVPQQEEPTTTTVGRVFKPATPGGKRLVWPPPPVQASTPTVALSASAPAPALQRSTSLLTWAQPLLASETSSATGQQQQHRSSVMGISSANAVILHEISSQPWEISCGGDRPQPVIADTAVVTPTLQSQTQTSTVGSFQASHAEAVAGATMVVPSAAACGPSSQQQQAGNSCAVHAPQAAASFGGALLTPGGFCEELKDFDFDCPNWEMPSLTRETSLARAVEALGGEGSVQGVGDEASFGSGW